MCKLTGRRFASFVCWGSWVADGAVEAAPVGDRGWFRDCEHLRRRGACGRELVFQNAVFARKACMLARKIFGVS